MDLDTVTLLVKNNTGFIAIISFIGLGAAGALKIMWKKSTNIKVKGNNNTVAGRDVSKN